jgi:hypothetical protein
MQGMYLITADDRPRVRSRILMIFDQQRIAILSFIAVRLGEEICMRIDADIDACDGRRVQALLYRNEDVQTIRAVVAEDRAQSVASYYAVCEGESQMRLLQVLAGLGAIVTLINDGQIVFEVEGGESELLEMEQRLMRYWPIERFIFAPSAQGVKLRCSHNAIGLCS